MKPVASRILLPAIVFLLVLTAPAQVEARPKHYFGCTDCHSSGLTLWSMDNSNVCLKCHNDPPQTWTLRDGDRTASSSFTLDDASDAMGSHPGTPANQTSHNWATTDDTVDAAGATRPLNRYLYGRYNVSAGKITCSRCHNPHGNETSPDLLKFDNSADQYCLDCHRPWDVANADALETHPIVSDYNAVVAASPDKYNASPVNTGSGDVRLVGGGVSCSSCHGMHYTDSDSATADGLANYNSLNTGDGYLLRSDGLQPYNSAVLTRNQFAQLRSNLCQACHTYQVHGKGVEDTEHQIGCLDCHGGHSYNGGSPNAFVLNAQTPDAVPTRTDGTNDAGTSIITFPAYNSGDSTRTKWADESTSATGYCEQCHGDINAMTGSAAEHATGDTNECTACHKHNDPSDVFSFNVDASAATCGQCHGFPPYLNSPGNRDGVGTDGGYAYNDVDTPNYGYNSVAYFKDESATAHKTHAGADISTNPGDWYFIGTSGTKNCEVCHGPDAGTTAGGHRQPDLTTYPDTFRDVPFDSFASANGNLTPAHDTGTETCSQIYCHSNGFPRTGDGPTRSYASGTLTTPAWDQANGGGYNSIRASVSRCSTCHGNDATTMNSTNLAGTAAHQAHLGQETTGISYGCDVCHVTTASDSSTLAPGATDGRTNNGPHLNQVVDVVYNTTGSALYNALAINSVGPNYNTTDGTCSVYCHDPADTGITADWDTGDELAGTLNCDDCHGGLASDTTSDGGVGPITTGSHARHVTDANGPQLACADCHGTNSDAGTHAAHIDGVVDVIPPVSGASFNNICEECHGYDSDPGEVLPVWGDPATTDCATCHAGTSCGAVFDSMSPPNFNYVRSAGHNRPAASGNYPESGNAPGDLACLDCHVSDDSGHWNGIALDTFMLRTDDGFPATYGGSEDAFCDNCHGSAPASVNTASAATQNVNTHQAKQCIACHNIHGTANIQMVHQTKADQIAADSAVSGKYAADVFFTDSTTFPAGDGSNSYDEDDGTVGVPEGATDNHDDICATCHSEAAGTLHNNAEGTGSHSSPQVGTDCFLSCHAPHTDGTDAFGVAAGTACNDCHGFPPATAAHRTGTVDTDPELHSSTVSNDKDVEDRTDCAFCHTGADLYTYDLAADQGSGDPDRDNHGVSQTNRQNVLFNSVGYSSSDGSCATACHASSATDGFWSDADGVACDACHYYSATPTSAGNAGDLTLSHDEHFDAAKGCGECHPVENAGTPLAGPLPHITDKSGASDGAVIQGMAVATQDEAGVTRTGMTYDDVNNTCSGGIGLACHATGIPDWNVAIPNDATGCADCHTDTTTATVNPTSGLHDNSVLPVTSGVPHDGAFAYNGGANNADCATCHTTSPSTAHMDGVLDASYNTVTIAASVGFTDGTTPTCTTGGLTGCHLEGTTWERKWDASAYNNNATRCANCHGDYASGWVAGTIHAEAGNETRGSTHNNSGSESYPCSDCHVIGASTGNYTYTDDTNDWAGTSHHGDDVLQINYNTTGFVEDSPTAGRVGCNTATCHGVDSSHDHLKSSIYSTGNANLSLIQGDIPDVSCAGCHGGGTVGTNANNYWPDSSNANVENTAGEHAAHIEKLSLAVYGEQYNTVLLTDNGNGTADAKQQELCSYCHDNPGGDADHGDTANLPAETNTFYTMWSKTLDDGSYSSDQHGAVGNDTCSNLACHNEKPTTVNVDGWYDGSATACSICHSDITAEAAHNNHTGAAATFGRGITCDDCHQTGAENVAWGAPGTPPATGHLDGTFTVTGSVAFTYNGAYTDYATSTGGSCGTNACHNDGTGSGAPLTAPYNWGNSLADCSICHGDETTGGLSGAHGPHYNSTAYVPGNCNDCHTPASDAAHIAGSINYNTAVISGAPGDGSCTNTCHAAGDAGDWTGGTVAIACADCHGGTYIGGDNTGTGGANYMPQYAMHTVTPVTTGAVHTDTGLGTTCDFCHDSLPAPGGTHVDGVWEIDSGTNASSQTRGMFTAYTEAIAGDSTCATTCHTAGTAWDYRWNASAGASDETRCANCHGYWAVGADGSGWRTGTSHAENPTRGSSTNHNDASGAHGYECFRCHVLGDSGATYAWTEGTNDWDPTDGSLGSTQHGDGIINMNDNGVTANQHDLNGAGRSGCTSCHEGADGTGTGNTHDYPASVYNMATLASADQVSSGEGGCTSCHGDSGTGAFWPQNSNPAAANYPNRIGTHLEHVSAIATEMGGDTLSNRNATCNYCHKPTTYPDTYESGVHNDNVIPSNVDDIRHILNYNSVDADPVVNRASDELVTCSTVDCHFNNAVTPHWYTDTVAPADVTLNATAGPNPRSIRVQWNAPGDDNNVANTTPYVYDMRYSVDDGGTDANNFASTTNHVGGLPAAYKQGYNSVAVAENLTPGSNYYFSLRTRDTAGNWSAGSAVVGPVTPTVDTQAPYFSGADRADKGDEDATINLTWTPGEDHTMPITYKIWMTAEGAGSGAGGALDMDVDTPIITGWQDHQIQLTAADGVVNDTIYNLGVRACDPLNNCDTNTEVVSSTPTAPPKVDKTYHTYVTNGSTTLVKDGTSGTQASASPPLIFTPSTNLTYDVTYFVDTFAVYLDVGKAGTARAEIGYSTNGSDFVGSGKTVDVSYGDRSDRVYQFKFGDVAGEVINAGQRIAIQLTDPGGQGFTAIYGTATERGDVTVAERIVNVPPDIPTDNGTAMNAYNTAVVDIDWTAVTDPNDGLADSVHYDLYANDGIDDYLIADDLTTTTYSWDAQASGVPFGSSLSVNVFAGDTYNHATPLTISGLSMPAVDGIKPDAVTDLAAEKRPKSGTVWLTWTAPGDDGANHGRAAYYDIRYSTSAITNDTDFNNATEVTGEPYPDFGGEIQNYEVTGLNAGTAYYFAIKTVDEQGNTSPLSSAKTAGSDQQVGGPRCGMCHTTAPSVDESVGNHKLHGFTLNECDKCHDDGVNPPSTYGLDHQDGVLKMGYGPGGAHAAATLDEGTTTIYYTDDGTPGGTKLYEDTNGWGGFGDGTYNSVGDGIDSGTCINFGALGVGGCHGNAGTDPDGAATRFPTYPTPTWDAAATLDCSACHGNPDRTTDNFYGRDFDATIDNGGVPTEQILGSPAVDNHGNYADDGSGTVDQRRYIGQHEKHLNYSFRFSKGDSCNLCHAGEYSVKTDLDGRHGNGEIDVQLDLNAAGPDASIAYNATAGAQQCFSMSPESCHPTTAEPLWDTAQTFECIECHGMDGVVPSHVTDPAGSGFADDGLGNCQWCHFGGHPRDDVGGTSLILGNSSQVGINYRSGGIHLRKSIGGRASAATEAELCWSCHDSNGISEWGTDTGANNTSTEPPNASDYDYGSVDTSNWTTATWSSNEPNFAYKTGAIQSTHSTNETGTSAVSGTGIGTYTESPDTVDKIRCSNCHDVHNLNKAPGDDMTGQPYLRGSWIRNPYPEDGAPWNKTYTTVLATFGAVPRAGGNEMGGFQIDQNNGNPTAGLSLAGSAGLCTLCHGTDVDNMNKNTSEGNLWVGTGNGHSNATIGGTASSASNIFANGVGGRPTPVRGADSTYDTADVFDMALQQIASRAAAGNDDYGYGYRGGESGPGYTPPVASKDRSYTAYQWGATVDAGTTDVGYHAFTCSKCHNPHASRLPKLMITNCLDTDHNTWQTGQGSQQTVWTSTADGANSEWTATHNTAQNCHRYDAVDNVGGWNKVTPWDDPATP